MDLHNIIGYCEATSAAVECGTTNALDGLAEMRAVIAAAQDALKVIDPLAIVEAEKHHEKTFEHGGLKFTRTDGKRAFKFDHLKEWADAKHALAAIEERAKNAALQAEKKLIVAGEDGEVLEAAIVTYGKPSLSISRK